MDTFGLFGSGTSSSLASTHRAMTIAVRGLSRLYIRLTKYASLRQFIA